jgi:DNA-binding GntR family transcriptional regulator
MYDLGMGSDRTQLRDEVAAYVRELIASGKVKPGDRLPVQALADAVEVSVTPAREALLLLVQEGSVVQEVNRGFQVATISRRDVADAYLVHAFVAGELAARAASKIDDSALAELRYLDSAIKQACDLTSEGHDMRKRIEELNYQLHGVVYTCADSPRLWSFVDQASHLGPRRFWVTIPGWVEFNRNGHADVIAALLERDPEASRAAMTRHLEQASEILLAHLDSLDMFTPPVPDSDVGRDRKIQLPSSDALIGSQDMDPRSSTIRRAAGDHVA